MSGASATGSLAGVRKTYEAFLSKTTVNPIAIEIKKAARRPLKSQFIPQGWTPPDTSENQLSYDGYPEVDEVEQRQVQEPKSTSHRGRDDSGDGEVEIVSEQVEARRRAARTLSDRGLARMFYEIDRREARFEWVLNKAMDNVAREGGSEASRPLRDEWLDRFFRYVADVDEQEVLEVLAKALSEAAARDKPLMSPRALDTLRYFQPDSYRIFVDCSTLLTMLGCLPLGFFDDEDTDMSALEVLQEAGLVKVETARYYVLPLGDFICTFTYQHDERFDFEIVRLTQIGREIAGLIKNELRQVPDAIRSGGRAGALLDHQLASGLTDATVRRVAQALLRSMSDRWAIQTTVMMRTPNGNRKVLEVVRGKFQDLFGFSLTETADNESDRLIDVVARVFTEFDENELPVLVEGL